MLNDFKTSINKILNERLTSPFWGAFILSWLVWNWRIPYVSLFVDQSRILPKGTTRIDYIVTTCIEGRTLQLLLYPFISTAVIIALFPFITTLAYWVFLKFNKWKTDMKNKVDGATLLTLEKSVQLREELRNLNKRYDSITKESEEEIRILRAEIVKLQEEQEKKDEQLALNEKTISDLETQIQVRDDDYSNKPKTLNEMLDKQKQVTENALKNVTESKVKELEKKLEEEQQKNAVFNNKVDSLYQSAFKSFNENIIKEVFRLIDKGEYISANHRMIRKWKRLKMLEIVKRHSAIANEHIYELTPLGEELRAKFYGEE